MYTAAQGYTAGCARTLPGNLKLFFDGCEHGHGSFNTFLCHTGTSGNYLGAVNTKSSLRFPGGSFTVHFCADTQINVSQWSYRLTGLKIFTSQPSVIRNKFYCVQDRRRGQCMVDLHPSMGAQEPGTRAAPAYTECPSDLPLRFHLISRVCIRDCLILSFNPPLVIGGYCL